MTDDTVLISTEADHQQQQQPLSLLPLIRSMTTSPTSDDDDDYYDLFDEATNRGRVFIEPINLAERRTTTLTSDEETSRKKYQETCRRLLNTVYDETRTHPIVTTKEEVLQQRIVAPCLSPTNVSNRSTLNETRRICQRYPQSIHPWTEFQEEVQSYHLGALPLSKNDYIPPIFFTSLTAATHNCYNESNEQQSLELNLINSLQKTGIVSNVGPPEGTKGRIDFCVTRADGSIAIVCECKATHNLLLPISANECVTMYSNAYTVGMDNEQRTTAWANVARPIGQLLCYMVDNGQRYGVLTSGTRTHFLKIQGPEIDTAPTTTTSSTCVSNDADPPGHTTKKDDAMGGQAKKIKSTKGTKRQEASSFRGTGSLRLRRAAKHLVSSCRLGSKREDSQGITRREKKSSGTKSVPADSSLEYIGSLVDIGSKVYISDAWCVGEVSYLRAWAYMYSLHETMIPLTKPTNWLISTKETKCDTPGIWKRMNRLLASCAGMANHNVKKSISSNDMRPVGNNFSGKTEDCCNLEYYFTIHQGALLYAPMDDIVLISVIGQGRNGDCFKVKWNDTEYAMKQFDIGRDGDMYLKMEIEAYMLLQDAWGILVPQPIFLSESFSGGIMFLGLQLGRALNPMDYDSSKINALLVRLEMEYSIQRNDAEHGRNMIVITDSIGNDILVAIDFEDWVDVRHYQQRDHYNREFRRGSH